ncbi:hypothetical protein M2387_000121 [Klebsiella sp. BIGb0407]|nr:hypothetical protein [Klebsiella sp. BIGb0407]
MAKNRGSNMKELALNHNTNKLISKKSDKFYLKGRIEYILK